MPLRFEHYITRPMLRNEPKALWVFGDNLVEWGLGGQASQMRGEPNAVGLPTKQYPAWTKESFLQDKDLATVKAASRLSRLFLARHLQAGGIVVWPAAGIGTGRAELATRAPGVKDWYDDLLKKLQRIEPVEGKSEWVVKKFGKHFTQIHGKRWNYAGH